MTAEQITVYIACDTNDRGYARNHLAYFPIAAAAGAFLKEKHPNLGYYSTVQTAKAIRLADTIYLLDKEISERSVISIIKTFEPVNGYQKYQYDDGFDKSVYFTELDRLDKILEDGHLKSIKSVILFRDDSKFYLLSKKEPIKLESFIMSRELATAYALSKLSEEEQKLLGLK